MLIGCDETTTITVKIQGKNYMENKYQVSLNDIRIVTARKENSTLDTLKILSTGLYNDVVNFINVERVEPVDAVLEFDKTKENPFVITSEINGNKVDEKKLVNNIIDSLTMDNKVLTVDYELIKANITKEDLERITTLRSEYTTSFKTSSEGRKHNIKLATFKINGSVIMPNDTFSFNEVVGKRNIQNWYKNAIIRSNGKFTEGVGGGVCQVSTTLYNCMLFGGAVIGTCNHHSLPVAYTPPSTDCMVSSWSDFTCRNATKYPMYILAACDNEKVTFRLYGQKMDYQIKREHKVTEVVGYKTVISEDEERPGKNGLKSYAKLIYYRNGKEFFSEVIRKDYYLPQDELVLQID